MRNALLAGLLILTAACGGYQFPGGSPTPAAGTVSGRVLAVPCAAIEPADGQCIRPVPNLELDYVLKGESRTEKTFTNAKGNYSVALPPGTYAVKVKPYMRIISGPTNLTVGAGTSTVADYVVDSGLRISGPAQPSS
jgi:hypothetical protein